MIFALYTFIQNNLLLAILVLILYTLTADLIDFLDAERELVRDLLRQGREINRAIDR